MGSMASMCSSVEVHADESKPEFTDLNMNHMFLGAIYSVPDRRFSSSSLDMDLRSSTGSIRSGVDKKVNLDYYKGRDTESIGNPLQKDIPTKVALNPESKELLMASAITREQLIDIPWIEEDAVTVRTLDLSLGSTEIEVVQ
ncbi:hypothetical protein TCAL_11234 [Tigriopus californicus]|uniref:Uncharacterized protein n=1 Tax=Tigriopus californicus TaxID=6832 RepID=A0A553N8V0_TIGCA|nr:hypothetical protein TCAL_11234 [Tigriopus californicus]